MQLTGLGLGLVGDFKEVAKGGVAGVVTATAPWGAGAWGSALGPVLRGLGGLSGQGFLVLPPFPVQLSVPGGSLPLPGGRAAVAALQRTLIPRFSELLFDHVPYRDVDRSARRVLVGVLVLINPVWAQLFAGPVRAGPNPLALLAEAVGVSFHPQPVFHILQVVGAHILAELEAPGHAAFALGVAVAVVLTPHQPRQ